MGNASLSRKQFDIMSAILDSSAPLSQRALSEKTGISLTSVHRTLRELTELGYIIDNQITENGLGALEPYRVRRAIILAAGFGARLMPISLNTPKPLVRVKGIRIIDTLLDALIAAEITDITIVRGHLGEQFDSLLYKYPMLKFLNNPKYMESENIVSALCAKDLFPNAYLLEGDLVLHNSTLIRKYEYCSNYLAVPVQSTDDWCFHTKKQYISQVSIGGKNCFHMFGISYWSKEDGAKLKEDLPYICTTPGGMQRFWDQVPLEYCAPHYKVEVRRCSFEDISEVDTLSDLRKLDKSYGEVAL